MFEGEGEGKEVGEEEERLLSCTFVTGGGLPPKHKLVLPAFPAANVAVARLLSCTFVTGGGLAPKHKLVLPALPAAATVAVARFLN